MTKFESAVRAKWPDHADTILGLIRGTVDPMTFPPVAAWVGQCYHAPKRHELVAAALDVVIGGFGVEAVFRNSNDAWPELEYVNQGDTYNTTLVYRRDRGAWRVSTMGDEVERLGL